MNALRKPKAEPKARPALGYFAFLVFTASSLLGTPRQASAFSGASFQKLISQGQQRPDSANPAQPVPFLDVGCAVVEGNNVVFRALSDALRAGYDSIWTIKTDGSGLRKLVGKTHKVPGGVGNFTAFGSSNGGDYTNSPLLRNGQVVFYGYDENPDSALRTTAGLYSASLAGGKLRRIANYKTISPSNPAAGAAFTQFGGESGQNCHNGFVFNGSTVLFHAAADAHGGIYRANVNGGNLQKVRDDQDIDYPDLPDVGESKLPIANYFGPALSLNAKTGKPIFGYLGASVLGVRKSYVNGVPRNKDNLPLPGDPTPEKQTFNYLQLDGGNAVFYAKGGTDYFGLFSKANSGAPIRKLVSNLSTLPGMPCPIDALNNSFVADGGRVFFWAHTTNCDGHSANGYAGIFMAQGGKIARIVSYGDDLGDGATALEIFDELGPGSVQGNRLVFTLRTNTEARALYAADLLP